MLFYSHPYHIWYVCRVGAQASLPPLLMGKGHQFYEVEVIRGLCCLPIPLEEIIFNKCSVISLLQVGPTIGGFAVGQTSLLCTKSYATKES